jgi:hypothetical protein
MAKFDKAEKTRLSDVGFWSIRFLQIQRRIEEEAKLENLKIQVCFKHRKGK